MSDYINRRWSRDKLEDFKEVYKKARIGRESDETFEFDGVTYVIGYAKYLIEYLENNCVIP